jgi:hypothetical protein
LNNSSDAEWCFSLVMHNINQLQMEKM